MGKKTDFAVYATNRDAQYTMAYNCQVSGCGQPVVGYSDDAFGLFVGTCGNGHRSTVMAS
ncbi:hypothetical protein [Streptosporangium sp. NPDC049644]|uniref:hypothetical protein n=1 Tax=Streptosporangium sp. NPDC049644 TaxID=3155507 RepID=UPI00341E6DCA